MKIRRTPAVLAVAVALSAPLARGHGDDPAARTFDPAAVVPTPFGQEGDPRKVTRTIRVEMTDAMRYAPAALTVKRDETVRFVARNAGKVMHEMVLGTPAALARHAELMKKHPGMEHAEPSMAHVKPGASGDIVWQFTRAGEFRYACLQPGHFEAGMVGTISVR